MNTRVENALEEFRPMCRIPHASGYETAIGAYLKHRLEELGYPVKTDAVGNLIAEVPAVGGHDNAPVTVLQAHMDMVLAGTVPPEQAVVNTVLEGDVLHTDGTTSLGADNGIGAAVILALLQDPAFVHGPLRILFTVSEEVGLYGARNLSADWLADASFMINTDGFHSNTALIGCMSGRRETFTRALDRESVPAGSKALRLSLHDYVGGHSGDDIDRGRCNTVACMAGLLRSLRDSFPALRVASFGGGTAFNAIPGNSEAVVVFASELEVAVSERAETLARELLDPYAEADPHGSFSMAAVDCPESCWAEDDGDAVLWMASELWNGVAEREENGAVASSCNLGELKEHDGMVELHDMLRCNSQEREERLAGQHRTVGTVTGFSGTVTGYPAWYGTEEGTLARLSSETYRELTGEPICCKRALVGVEPAYFQGMAPRMEIVCLGAAIENAHSVEECVHCSGIDLMYRLMDGMLCRIAEM